MKCLDNFNKIVSVHKSLKFAALKVLKDVNFSVLTTQFICAIEIVQLQQLNKDWRILKEGTNMNITPKPHRFWSGFDAVFFIWHMQWSFMNVSDCYPQLYELWNGKCTIFTSYLKFSK